MLPTGAGGRLYVVMVARDALELLHHAVTSLLDRAADASLNRLIVVDNRSVRAETVALLDGLRQRGIEVRTYDERSTGRASATWRWRR
ncbi:glycosyltransferase [Sphingomonas sp.]|uniref:glycosyltransferase n=1 Tax=Sphingomonas sp. TaxID=28214 RepID=UPI003AFF7D41